MDREDEEGLLERSLGWAAALLGLRHSGRRGRTQASTVLRRRCDETNPRVLRRAAIDAASGNICLAVRLPFNVFDLLQAGSMVVILTHGLGALSGKLS